MTYPAPDILPYDPWFDPNYNWLSTDKEDGLDYEGPVEEEKEETIHEKLYQIATSKYNPFSVGGSENIHDFDKKNG
tara:strand:- start:432 stop:659 length:228 start_codon:yes stop_codon:yes gene_type:complete